MNVSLVLWELSLARVFVSVLSYFQQPQGETVTDASLLCPRVRLACGVVVTCTTSACCRGYHNWEVDGVFETGYLRMRCAAIIIAPHRWNPMWPNMRM